MKKFIQIVKLLTLKKNWRKLTPYILALVVAVAGILGAEIDKENTEAIIAIIGGLVFALIGILDNNDKKE